MNFKRIGRLLVCLVLICALLINVSPIKAKAVATELTVGFVAVTGVVAIAAIFQALGIMASSEPVTFNNRVNECFQYIKDTTSYVVDGFISVFGSVAALDAGMASYLPRDLIQAVWEWINFSGLVGTVEPSVPANASALFTQRLDYAKTFPYALMIETASSVVLAISQSPFVFDSEPDGDLIFRNATNTQFQVCNSASNYAWFNSTTSYYSPGTITQFGTSYVGVEDGLVLGQFQSSKTGTDEEIIGIEFCPLYVDWATGEISQKPPSHDDRDPIPFWPVGIPSTDYEDVVHQDQQQAQSGQTGIDFESSESGDDSAELNWWQQFSQWFLDIRTAINELPNRFDEHFENVNNNIQEVPSKFETWIQNVQTSVDAVAVNILGTADEINAAISGLPNTFGAHFQNILSAIAAVPEAIVVGLRSLFQELFVPSEEYLNNKFQELTQKFPYLEPIISLGDTFKAYLSGVNPTPPVIWIDLGASQWHPLGGRVKFIDLTWYAQYKPTVDGILGAFLWLCLLWRLFQAAPGIVQGASGFFGNADPHPDGSFSGSNWIAGQRFLTGGFGKRNE